MRTNQIKNKGTRLFDSNEALLVWNLYAGCCLNFVPVELHLKWNDQSLFWQVVSFCKYSNITVNICFLFRSCIIDKINTPKSFFTDPKLHDQFDFVIKLNCLWFEKCRLFWLKQFNKIFSFCNLKGKFAGFEIIFDQFSDFTITAVPDAVDYSNIDEMVDDFGESKFQ